MIGRRKGALSGIVLVAGVGVGVSFGFLPLGHRAAAGTNEAPSVKTATVERRTLATHQTIAGTLGFGRSYQVVGNLPGVLSGRPEPGTVIGRGQSIYEVNGSTRAILMYGSRPAWRTMRSGISDGSDVKQLEQTLKALGFAPRGMKIDRHWDRTTTEAVRRWQKASGLNRDGSVDFGEVVFLPESIRVTSVQAILGGQIAPGQPILDASSTIRVVQVELDLTKQDPVHVGQAVSIEMPDRSKTTGKVTAVGRVATATGDGSHPEDQSSSIAVEITPDSKATVNGLDRAPVTVSVVGVQHASVLAVPVAALLARPDGGYGVEIVDPDGSRHVQPVQLGLFDDGYVEISGERLAAGMTVVTAA